MDLNLLEVSQIHTIFIQYNYCNLQNRHSMLYIVSWKIVCTHNIIPNICSFDFLIYNVPDIIYLEQCTSRDEFTIVVKASIAFFLINTLSRIIYLDRWYIGLYWCWQGIAFVPIRTTLNTLLMCGHLLVYCFSKSGLCDLSCNVKCHRTPSLLYHPMITRHFFVSWWWLVVSHNKSYVNLV